MSSVKQAPKPLTISSPLLAGLVFSLLWLASGALILSFMLHFTGMQESDLSMYALLVHGLSSLAGGLTAGKRSIRRGWYHGGFLGMLYGIIIVLVSFLATNNSVSLQSFVMLGTVLLAGALGGMIGVNLKRQ